MEEIKAALSIIADNILIKACDNPNEKPNYSNRDFLNAVIIFQSALMDKLYDMQDFDKMDFDNRLRMAESCGVELRKLIHTYTGIDTHKIDELL